MEIKTQRLLLRPFIDTDPSTVLRLLTDAEIKETVMEKAGMEPNGKETDIEYRGRVHHCIYFSIHT